MYVVTDSPTSFMNKFKFKVYILKVQNPFENSQIFAVNIKPNGAKMVIEVYARY